MNYEFNFRTFKVLAIEMFQLEIEHLVENKFLAAVIIFYKKTKIILVCKNSIKKKHIKKHKNYFECKKIGKLLFCSCVATKKKNVCI